MPVYGYGVFTPEQDEDKHEALNFRVEMVLI